MEVLLFWAHRYWRAWDRLQEKLDGWQCWDGSFPPPRAQCESWASEFQLYKPNCSDMSYLHRRPLEF